MRIAIVNDMGLAVEGLRRWVRTHPPHEVAWTASNGQEAVAKAVADRPDLILMDLLMPVMDGVEATRRIMLEAPTAILIVTASVDSMCSKVFEALGAGAMDAVNTPSLGPGGTDESLARKVEIIARLRDLVPAQANSQATLVAIGSSSGGPAALATVLQRLPAQFASTVVVVQHIDVNFMAGLVQWLSDQLELRVRLAQPEERPQPGCVYFPAQERHLVISRQGTFAYTDEPAVAIHKPSIDTLFESVASNWKGSACGILLTGMGRDGARGLLALRKRGFVTIAQDQASSLIYGMPKAAVECGAAQHVLGLDGVGDFLLRLGNS